MVHTKFRYTLDPGSKKFRCPACNQKRFVRYLDEHSGDYLMDDVGRCDREISCGYHKPPRDADGLDMSSALYSAPKPVKAPTPSTLPSKFVTKSMRHYDRNTFVCWLSKLPGWDQQCAEKAARLYKVGTSSDGWVIFWQIDQDGKVRSGKMMKYDPSGHRVKDGYSQDWVHSKLKRSGHIDDFELVQCFFGLHIVDDTKAVAIVESEKTAIIASQYLPQFHWIATGMLHGINEYKLRPLKGRKVVLFPDIGAFTLWSEKALEISHIVDVHISALLEQRSAECHKGFDIADYLIQHSLDDFLNPYERNPYTGEIFDHRGYPKDWDDTESEGADNAEYQVSETEATKSSAPVKNYGTKEVQAQEDPMIQKIKDTFDCIIHN